MDASLCVINSHISSFEVDVTVLHSSYAMRHPSVISLSVCLSVSVCLPACLLSVTLFHRTHTPTTTTKWRRNSNSSAIFCTILLSFLCELFALRNEKSVILNDGNESFHVKWGHSHLGDRLQIAWKFTSNGMFSFWFLLFEQGHFGRF